jgi:hypothetical protein
MRYLLLGIFMVLSPFVFTQTEEDSVTYELFFTEKTTDVDGKIKTDRYIKYEPNAKFLKEKNITNRDTIAVLSYISLKALDSLNQLRVKKGLNILEVYDLFSESEYGYNEESIFDYSSRKNVPLMVTDIDYDIDSCECVIEEVINEISSHKEIMRRILSKRAKLLDICVIADKKTNMMYIYVSVKRFFTLSYFIG